MIHLTHKCVRLNYAPPSLWQVRETSTGRHAKRRHKEVASREREMKYTRRWLRLLTASLIVVACSGRRPGATVRPTLRPGQTDRQKTRPSPNGLWHELFPADATPLEKVLKATLTPVVMPFVLAQLLAEQCLSLARGAVTGTRRVLQYVLDRVIVPALRGIADLLLSCARLIDKALSAIHVHFLRPLASGVHKYLVVPTSKALDRAGALLGDVLTRAFFFMFRMLCRLDRALEAVYIRLDRAFEAVGEAVGKAYAALARAIDASASWLVRVARRAARLADWTLLNLGVYFAIDLVGKAASFTARSLHGALLRVGRVLTRVVTTLTDAASRMVRAVRAGAALTLRVLNQYLVQPVHAVVRAISQAAWKVITTAGRALATALSTAGRAVADLLTVAGRATARAAADARRAFIVWWRQPSWLSEVLFKPLLRRAVSAVQKLLRVARWLSWNVALRPVRVLVSASRYGLRIVGRTTRAAGQTALACLRAVSTAAQAAGRALRRSAVAVASQVRAVGRAVARPLLQIAEAIRAAGAAVGAPVLATARSLSRAAAELAAELSRSAREIARAIMAAARSLAQATASAFRGGEASNSL